MELQRSVEIWSFKVTENGIAAHARYRQTEKQTDGKVISIEERPT